MYIISTDSPYSLMDRVLACGASDGGSTPPGDAIILSVGILSVGI